MIELGVHTDNWRCLSGNFQTAVSLVTPALTGTYRINFYCELACSSTNKSALCQLLNVTDSNAEVCYGNVYTLGNMTYIMVSGFGDVSFVGAAKTFRLQYAAATPPVETFIRRARLEIWKEG